LSLIGQRPQWVFSLFASRIQGTREIRVILYAKDDPFCASASAYELSIEDILAVEYDVIPLDGADVFQQGEIDSIGDWVALTQDPGDFAPCQ
jgi:hypothetical protein